MAKNAAKDSIAFPPKISLIGAPSDIGAGHRGGSAWAMMWKIAAT